MPKLNEFLFLVNNLKVRLWRFARFAIKLKQNNKSFEDQTAPYKIYLPIRFIKAAINLLGKLGALKDKSKSLKNRDLVSVSISKTDLSAKPSPRSIF